MARRSIKGARCIVTGTSSGIGREISLELARHGARQIITARREPRLRELAEAVGQLGGEAHPVAGDITDAGCRQSLLDAAKQQLGGLDILINNAGVGAIGPFAEASPERLRQVMEVDFFAPAELIRAALPMIRQGTSPTIVNVASVLGHRAVPNKSEYCSAKFALHGLSDALRAEFKEFGVHVLLVSPSTTKTEFFDNVLETRAKLPWLAFGAQSATAVARRTVKALRAGRHEIILSPGGKGLVWFDRLCPPLVNRLVARFAK